MDKLLIVDGSNLLFQMFYGMPARIINSDGKPIQGTLGFVGALLKMIRMTQPSHIAVLFDGESYNARVELDGDYKANRPDYSLMEEEDTPFSQLPDIYAALDYMGICNKETIDCEADDWIASYAIQYGDQSEIVISSQDSDFFQLINDKVSVLRYRGDKTIICNRENINEKLGIEPEQYADFKSMTGDTADNIRGAEKIGPKTAAALLKQFGDIETMLRNVDCIAKPSIRESVIRNRDRIILNYKLIKLEGKAYLPFTKDEMKYDYNGITTGEVLKAIGLR